MFDSLILKFLTFLAGFIDSVVGGGGLITLPIFTFLLGPGPAAVGTNKIVAVVAALTALVSYARKGHLNLKIALPFLIATGLGTFVGARLALVLPVSIFRVFILIICPFLLYIILNKNALLKTHPEIDFTPSKTKLILAGLACGIYDGVLGPGGGTFMLLSLVIWAKLPLMMALASSKLANTISASTALTTFAINGVIHWEVGLKLTLFVFLGALLGSSLANKKAELIARPMLVLVVVLLMIKLAMDQFS